MISNKSITAAMAALLAGGAMAYAQSPVVNVFSDRNKASLEMLSDNGEWAVGYGAATLTEVGYSFPKLYNVKTKETKQLFTSSDETNVAEMMACDVTNDGSLVVGQYKGKPAIWRAATEEWTILTYNGSREFSGGRVTHVTPDGKIAIGTVTSPSWNETLVMWDLSGDQPVEITPDNLPKPISMFGTLQDYEQIRSCDLSPDGTKFIGLVAFSYAGESWTFVYDMTTKEWTAIGYDVKDNGDSYEFTATGEGYAFLEGGRFRPFSNEIAGQAYFAVDSDGLYTYNLDTKEVTLVGDSENMLFGCIDRYGLIYASEPSSTPIRNWVVKAGNYWYDFKVIYRQIWGQDWQEDVLKDDVGRTGTFMTMSEDANVFIASDYASDPYRSFVVELPEPLSEVCQRVNLLSNNVVYPVDNSAFAILKEMKVYFDRNIELIGEQHNAVVAVSENGEQHNSVSVAIDPGDSKTLNITFRNRRLNVGETYTVTIPEGLVSIAGDAERINPEITVSYKGRPQAPVAPVTISPADGTSVAKINASSNPIAITFDADISPVEDGGDVHLFLLNDDGNREEITTLSGSITGNVLSLYPVMEQRLARGFSYEIVIDKNIVADISGADPNEEFTIHYEGDWTNQTDPRRPFFDNFDEGITLDNWMLYDGDQLEPAETPTGWGFNNTLPWWVARDEEYSTDMAAVSHSMYSPVGKADDWLVTNQIYIADDSAVLSFKSQSYLKDKTDHLKVYVYESEDIYTALTSSIIDNIRYYGDLIYDEVQKPGEREEVLSDEWTENAIKLDKYADKYIYIAFVNDNRNQSAVFIDDVLVSRDVQFLVSNFTPASMVAKDNVTVRGILSIESQTETFKGYELKLVDAEGNVISTVGNADVELQGGDEIDFVFPEPLTTPIGKEVKYTIDVKVGELTDKVESSVRNLAISTNKKVVIEEYTGQTCPNCPIGHAALDILAKDFGDVVIPLTIHTYPGDNFATPQAVQLQEFLGFQAAPTGRVNRRAISSPMEIVDGVYFYKNNGVWYDQVVAELNDFAEADIDITDASFDGENFNVNVDVKYALDMDNLNVNIFTVICEDNLVGIQQNNRATEESEVLGDWGKGGIYGESNVVYNFHDVVRTWAGTTCNGTGGYIPASVVGGQSYTAEIIVPTNNRIYEPANTTVTVMLIDANTGLVINANRAKVQTTGVEGIAADTAAAAYVENGKVIVNAASLTFVDVFAVDGTRLASQAAEGEFAIDLNGYKGVALVTLKNAKGQKTVKVFVK
ncbi:MAG: Omp28-related outer membrane protein [Bacteroides sp.]|nr:Omp28-related outer membrane protein [Bacteroides sp.]